MTRQERAARDVERRMLLDTNAFLPPPMSKRELKAVGEDWAHRREDDSILRIVEDQLRPWRGHRVHFVELYHSLCNVLWINLRKKVTFSVTWRAAGGIAAEMCGRGEDYMAYYSGGREGTVQRWLAELLKPYGWAPRRYPA